MGIGWLNIGCLLLLMVHNGHRPICPGPTTLTTATGDQNGHAFMALIHGFRCMGLGIGIFLVSIVIFFLTWVEVDGGLPTLAEKGPN